MEIARRRCALGYASCGLRKFQEGGCVGRGKVQQVTMTEMECLFFTSSYT